MKSESPKKNDDVRASLAGIVASLAGVDAATLVATTRLNAIGLQSSVKRASLVSAIRRELGCVCTQASTVATLGELWDVVGGAMSAASAVPPASVSACGDDVLSRRIEAMAKGLATTGCGADIEAIANLENVADYRVDAFYCDHFTDAEIAYCVLQERPAEHFAARWAAKEALRKCENSFMAIPMNRVDVVKRRDGSVRLRCRIDEKWIALPHAVSLSHTESHAMAMVVGQCDAGTRRAIEKSLPPLPMEQPTICDTLESVWRTLGIVAGDTIFLHSDMTLAMALWGDGDVQEACARLLDALRRTLGPAGTVIVPTFNYDFCRGVAYDHATTPSQVGIFTEFVRTQSDAIRTFHPIFSCAAIGRRAEELADGPSRSSFGKGSTLDRLRAMGTKLVFFNVGFDACTYVHYMEQQANVDYRFLKYFTGTVSRNGETWVDTYDFFVRRDDAEVTSDFSRLGEQLVRENVLKRCRIGEGEIMAASCDAVYGETLRLLAGDRYALLKSPPTKSQALIRIVTPATGSATTLSTKEIVESLYPMNRTMASAGMDRALEEIASYLPASCLYRIERFASTLPAWTWRTLERYVVDEAYIEDDAGRRIVDVKDNCLHLVSYSPAIDRWMTWEDLSSHLHTCKTRTQAIPWRFKYYERDWGFCITQSQYDSLDRSQRYHVVIRSKFDTSAEHGLGVGVIDVGSMESVAGRMMLCAHLCHPMQANDDLSGVAVIVDVVRRLCERPLPKNAMGVRVLLCPETNGSVTYFANHPTLVQEIHGAMFCEMLGNVNTLALQHSRQGDAAIDRIAGRIVRARVGESARFGAFREIIGNDEMVINGPGVNVPCVSLTRYPYDEYHTSDDSPAIISQAHLSEAADVVEAVVREFCSDYRPRRRFSGPVFLSGVGLWVDHAINRPLNRAMEKIMLSLEGDRSISEIAASLDMDFWTVRDYLEQFRIRGLIAADGCESR